MSSRALYLVALVVGLPFLVSYVVYYGFGTNYTADVFHEEGFREQYESGVYRYRILGRYTLLGTHAFIESDFIVSRLLRSQCPDPPAGVQTLDDRADSDFYTAYFIQNTLFLVLCSIIMYAILARAPQSERTLKLTLLPLLIGLTQYVVCPYDTLSYVFILLTFLLIQRQFRYRMPILLLALAVSTLVRETAALAIPFFVADHWNGISRGETRRLRQLGLLTGTFLATYLLLRVVLGFNAAFWQNVRLLDNLLSLRCLLGFLALGIVAYPLAVISASRRKCLVFMLASSPYWLAMLFIAVTWELRLWVPVWLGLLVLQRLRSSPSGFAATSSGA
ncbi:hypothetical protein GF402_08480 [Candidatus Fermentibacteria bacterium]|nr:hypothetical protein [Candidatus Fermentibacteria bacterium]